MITYYIFFFTVPGGTQSPDGGFNNMMLMLFGWLVVATALFLFRPRNLRNLGDSKPANNVSWCYNICAFEEMLFVFFCIVFFHGYTKIVLYAREENTCSKKRHTMYPVHKSSTRNFKLRALNFSVCII